MMWTNALRSGLLARRYACRRARDLDHEAGTGCHCEAESMQLDDRRHEAQPESHAPRPAAPVGAIEAPGHQLALLLADARAGVAHLHDTFAIAAVEAEPDMPSCGRELDRVVDEIRDRFEQKIAVALHDRAVVDIDRERDVLLLGDRLVEVADLAHDVGKRGLAEPGQSPR